MTEVLRTSDSPEDRYRELFEVTGDWVWEVDQDGVILASNGKVEEFFGYRPDEVVGRLLLDLIPTDDRVHCAKELQQAFENHASVARWAHRGMARDGRVVFLETSALPVLDDEGALRGYVGVGRDVTSERLLEQAQREGEVRFRALFDSVQVGISLLSPDLKILSLNRSMRAWFPDIDPETRPLCYGAFNQPPRQAPCSYCPTVKTLEDGCVHEAITDTPTPDGVRNFRVVSSPMLDESGNVTGAIEMVEDVTEAVAAEEMLRSSRDAYRSLTSNIPGMVYRSAADWTVVIVSKCEEMSGYTAEALKSGGTCWFDLIHADDKLRVQQETAFLQESAQQMSQQYRIIRKDGGVRWVEDHKRSRFKEGRFDGVDGLVLDITVRKEAEAALEAKSNELRETTAQLIQTEKMSALGELAAGVAHEMNQPLNSIKIICQDLLGDIRKDRLNPEDLPPNLGDVVELVNKLAAIIDQMRMFVRRTDFSADDVCDVNTAMHGVFKMVGQQLRDNGFEVEMELEETLPLARANVVKLEQVLMNLISNARDAVAAHRTSGRALVVRTRLVERAFDENPGVAIEVQDNGPGISPAIRGRLIEPFFTTKQPGAGTGLGLSISHRIMAECGGRIEIESEEGQGALFRVVVPVPPAN